MKKVFIGLTGFILLLPLLLSAQDGKEGRETKKAATTKEYSITQRAIENKSSDFDKQILMLNKSIQEVIADSNLMKGEGIRTLPYQTEITYGPDKENPKFVQLTKHIYIKDGLYSSVFVGYEEKILKIYSDGKNVSQIETTIRTKNFKSTEEEVVTVIDTSPTTEGTDDIIIDHTLNGRKLIDQKKLGEVLNNVDSPIRNSIKSEFVIPNLSILYRNLQFITESNVKSTKDIDYKVSEFLKKSTLY